MCYWLNVFDLILGNTFSIRWNFIITACFMPEGAQSRFSWFAMYCTAISKRTSRWSVTIAIPVRTRGHSARISCDTARTMRCRLQMMIRMWRCRWCRDEKDGLGHRGQGLSWLSVRMHRGQSIGRGEAKGNHSLSYHHVQKQQEDVRIKNCFHKIT